VIGLEAETATVPEAFGKVMVRAAVGSVMAKVVLLASAVVPSKTSGLAPVMLPDENVMLPFAVKAWVTVSAPLLVVVMPVRPKATEVAFAVPRFRAVAASSVSAPEEVDQVEAAPAVRVSAAAEVKDEAPVGVRFTLPAPVAVKLPEVRVKAMAFPDVVIVAPLLYACCNVTLVLVAQVAQPMSPAAESVIGLEAETATVPEAFGKVMVRAAVGSVMAKVVLLASAVVPSKTSGLAPVMLPDENVMLPFAVKAWVTVKAPFTVVVIPVRLKATEVAFVAPRLRAVAASSVSAPEEVDQVEAAPPVSVRAAPEVKDEAPVGVRLTLPAPVAVKFPEVRVKAMSCAAEVVMVWPAL